jgi:hypothetical protein
LFAAELCSKIGTGRHHPQGCKNCSTQSIHATGC